MKRPRRPVKQKKTPRDRVRLAKPSKMLEMTSVEAAVFDAVKAPAGVAYQWAPEHSVAAMQRGGWICVPHERHKDVLAPSLRVSRGALRGHIRYFGQVLFQRDAALVDRRRDAAHLAALDNVARHPGAKRRGDGQPFHILSPSFMVSSAYDRVPETAGTIDVSMEIVFRVPVGWRDVASALGLTAQEYARRRVLMDIDIMRKVEDSVFGPFELQLKRID